MPGTRQSLDLTSLAVAYDGGALTPSALVEDVLGRIARRGEDAIWISRTPGDEVKARAAALTALPPEERRKLPLYGIPFAAKDNIDVAGLPTTAGCPAFAYLPERSATVVQRLEAAGAICLGKTNLDQFATGLVGVRSPYGVPANPFDPAYIPGGSSSGSAVAVAAGLCSFALGTDTAGSGRVPASFNNIVGIKPTRGMIPCTGVVPACRSLDCVSVFALTARDAYAALDVAAGDDPADAYARAGEQVPLRGGCNLRVGVPRPGDLRFFGDEAAQALFAASVEKASALGGRLVEIDYAPFAETAALLYQGPWVAERLAAVEGFLKAQPDAFWPVTRKIIEGAHNYAAVDAFKAAYRLEALRKVTGRTWQEIDVMLLPTAGTIYTQAQLEADPVTLNTNLGFYTNFVNLLDLCAIALPAGFLPNGLPWGVTFLAPAWSDRALARLGQSWQRSSGLALGATAAPLPDEPALSPPAGEVDLAVVGAHLSGQPLNHELSRLGARLRRSCRTSPDYRLHALIGTTPEKPGLVRVAEGGAAIEVEVWRLSTTAFGRFVAAVPPPMTIGTLQLDDGSPVKGFLCEPGALAGSPDITAFGGWRAYRAAR